MVQDSVEVPYNIAAIYQAQGRYDEAIQVHAGPAEEIGEARRQVSRTARRAIAPCSWSGWARSTATRANNQAANETFREIVALGGDENVERGYQQIIDTWREAKEWQKATDAAKEAVQKLPNEPRSEDGLAAQQADMGDADKALKDVRAMLKGERQTTARCLHHAGADEHDGCAGSVRRSRRSTRPSSYRPSRTTRSTSGFSAAPLLSAKSAMPKPKSSSRKCWPAIREHASALNYLGYMLADQNMKLEEALGIHQEARWISIPANGAYLDSLGWAYFRLGKYELAEEQPAEGFAENQYRSHRARPSRRSVPEDRTPETGCDTTGSAR